MATSAYIHIPFCRRRCFYCDFAISVVGDRKRGETSGTMTQYIGTLLEEISAIAIGIPHPPLKTVFFGGGTPSLLAPRQVETILGALSNRFGIAADAEISMEMDPATFDLSHARGYRAAGVNRVSLGVQSFDNEVLTAAGRFHQQQDIYRAVDWVRQAGFENISLDLISGLPHQDMARWETDLTEAIALNPTHLSIYDLIVEPQTAFGRYFRPGEAPLPSDAATADMYRLAQQQLTGAGYEHYEICNFALPGYEAQHNLTYWQCRFNYGFGMGATSYLNHQRIDRPRTQKSYRVWVDAFVAQGGRTDDLVLSQSERVLEHVMMGLRLREGISVAPVQATYGEAGLRALEKAIAPHVDCGWVQIDSPTAKKSRGAASVTKLNPNCRIRLSDPEGFLMSNVVIVDAFNALEAVATGR